MLLPEVCYCYRLINVKPKKERVLNNPLDNLKLDSRAISALPIIDKFTCRLGLKKLLSSYMRSKPNQKLSHADAVLILVRNILLEREPLYKLSEWAPLAPR